jgi:hypothetical protein
MTGCNEEPTPLATKSAFTKTDCPQSAQEIAEFKTEATRYRSLAASINYLALWTRPDMSYATGKYCKFMQNPGPRHLSFLKRGLRYLKKTKSRCLLFDFSSSCKGTKTGVYGFYDASHADDLDTRRSTMGYTFFFDGALISWRSKLHTYVTLSTNNSEYCASAKAGREAKWLHKIFSSLGLVDAVSPIDLFSDSKGAISMNYNPVQHDANKHCDLADHYARELVDRGIITITFVSTLDMIADVFTKALAQAQFEKFISAIMAHAPLEDATHLR